MEKAIAKKRSYGLDFLKYVCCLLVIFIHMDLPQVMEWGVLPLTRVAVPIFFMITGYFYEQTCQKGREGKQMKKVLWLAVSANALHFGWALAKLILNGESLVNYFRGFLQKDVLLNYLVFNQPPYRTSLWYINGLLILLIVVFLLQKAGVQSLKKLYFLIPVLLVVNLLLGTYSFLFFDADIPLCYTRNGLVCGLPYFLLGDFINHYKIRLKNPSLIVGAIVFSIFSVIECCILRENGLLKTDHLFGTFFLVVFAFSWFVNNEPWLSNKKIVCLVAGLGAKYSFVIYIIHSIFIEFWGKGVGAIASRFPEWEVVLQYVGPFFILVLSTIAAVVWYQVKDRFVHKKESHRN